MVIWTESNFAQAFVTGGWEDVYDVPEHKDKDDHDHNLAQAFVTGGWEDADEAQKQRGSLAKNNRGTAFLLETHRGRALFQNSGSAYWCLYIHKWFS